jgi:hypothetical protein
MVVAALGTGWQYKKAALNFSLMSFKGDDVPAVFKIL